MKQQEAVLTIMELADWLRCSRSTVERLVKAGLPYIEIEGGFKRFLLKSVIQFMRENQKSVPQIPDQFKPKDERKQNDRLRTF